MDTQSFDVLIVGAGLVGLASAWTLLSQFPALRLAVVDKEPFLAAHQSTHNSGVIHAGIYYRPGSLKARNCRRGVELLTVFCREHGVPYQELGKLIVASSLEELPRLRELENRGRVNGVPDLRRVSKEELKELEPEVEALEGLYSPSTGVVNYRRVADALGLAIVKAGGRFFF